jgi:hypothetical protein
VWLIDLFMAMKEGEVMAIHVQSQERDRRPQPIRGILKGSKN